MNAGLPQGFVRFGSVAHRVLVYIHESGHAMHAQIVQDLDLSADEVGMCLTRLRRLGFIHRIGRASSYKHHVERTQLVYAIDSSHRAKEFENVKNKSTAERTRRYRERKAIRVPSIFDFRGKIRIKINPKNA